MSKLMAPGTGLGTDKGCSINAIPVGVSIAFHARLELLHIHDALYTYNVYSPLAMGR